MPSRSSTRAASRWSPCRARIASRQRSSTALNVCSTRTPVRPRITDMSREHLEAHLEFFKELGVDGLRRDPAWAARADAAPPSPPPPAPNPVPVDEHLPAETAV